MRIRICLEALGVSKHISACVLPYINRCRDLHPTFVFRVTNFGDYGLHSKVLVITNRITCEPNYKH